MFLFLNFYLGLSMCLIAEGSHISGSHIGQASSVAKAPNSLAVDSDYDSDGSEDDTDEATKQNEPAQGVVKAYLANLKAKIADEIHGNRLPQCYGQGQFWMHPFHPYFAMSKAATL